MTRGSDLIQMYSIPSRLLSLVFALSLVSGTNSSDSPRLISLEDGLNVEQDDYGFYPLSGGESISGLNSPHPTPRLYFDSDFYDFYGAVKGPVTNFNDEASSLTRSRFYSPENDDDFESVHLVELPPPSLIPRNLPFNIIRRNICCCFSDACLSFACIFCTVFYCIIYSLILRLRSSLCLENNRNKIVFNL